MTKKIFKIVCISILVLFAIGGFSLHQEMYKTDIVKKDKISFEVKQGESVSDFASRLQTEGIIKNADIFKLYLKIKKLDKNIQFGVFVVTSPITVERITQALSAPESNERSITIIPGWDLKDIALYFEKEGIATQKYFFALVGKPGVFQNPDLITPYEEEFPMLDNRSSKLSLEGYLAPETYRIYKNEKLESIIKRLLKQTEKEFTPEMLEDIQKKELDTHAILTLASIIEKEVKTPEDKKKVSDLFWRRVDVGMGLQADSTVHYLSGREGDVFTKAKERQIDSLWNTYKYRGLPPGPISNPSVSSILAAIYPEKNDFWYFLTTSEGDVKYAKTLDEHNANVAKYLR